MLLEGQTSFHIIALSLPLQSKVVHDVTRYSCSCPRHAGRGAEVYVHSFLTSVLDEGEWSTSRPGRFTPGDVMDPRACLEVLGPKKKSLASAEIRTPDPPACI